ncbi:MAG: purine-nucleoside phosphorylase [Peptococcaceae bacterium]|nr:purine-nucleoside phosphorylase [Peptococcaceae bacterium]
MITYEQINEAADFLSICMPPEPVLGLILGSGLGRFADRIENSCVISYEEIPHFPISTVPGHAGCLVYGMLHGVAIMAFQGRFHYYEGYDVSQVTLPVRVMQRLGIKKLLVTNAAGGVNTQYVPGDLVLLSDQINLTGVNPLRGAHEDRLGPRFPDMSQVFCPRWRQKAAGIIGDLGMKVLEGVYAGLPGPSYETPAEIRYLRHIGADLVGMSTVHEVIAAQHAGMEVLGISCVTNMAAGVLEQRLSHDDVMEVADRIGERFCVVVEEIVRQISD